MAKERNTRPSAKGAEQPKDRKPRGSAGTPSGDASAMEKAGRAAGRKPAKGQTGDDRERRVRDRAYEIWESEGRPSGREREHWEQAERES